MLRIALRGFHPKSLTASGEPLGFDYGQKCPPLRMTRRWGVSVGGDHWSSRLVDRGLLCANTLSSSVCFADTFPAGEGLLCRLFRQ